MVLIKFEGAREPAGLTEKPLAANYHKIYHTTRTSFSYSLHFSRKGLLSEPDRTYASQNLLTPH